MIHKLSVKNFKSIKQLEIDCRRINLFIGEPNAGKSNILETLGLLSWCGHDWTVFDGSPVNINLKEYMRLQGVHNLFYDNITNKSVEIDIRKAEPGNIKEISMTVIFKDDVFHFAVAANGANAGHVTLDYSGNLVAPSGLSEARPKFIKFFKFKKMEKFPEKRFSYLMPPYGSNMFSVVMGNRKLRASMARFFKDFGFELVFRPYENDFEFQKRIEDEDMDSIFFYPYIVLSDTLQRIIFYTIAIESNEDSTLIFEEPESHAFPYYTKYLGEKIAFDESNQYFIATHNPYLFLAILEKTPKDDVNVFVTYFEDYQTKVKCLDDEEKSEIMVYDPFFNLDSFIEDEEEDIDDDEEEEQ